MEEILHHLRIEAGIELIPNFEVGGFGGNACYPQVNFSCTLLILRWCNISSIHR